MPAKTAYRLCPQAIFLPPRFEVYRAVSAQIMAIFKSITPLVEPLSLDEAYLDITSSARDFQEAVQLARTIKERIREETGLTASAGVSFNKARCHVSCHEAQSSNKKNGRKEQKVHHFNAPRAFSQKILHF